MCDVAEVPQDGSPPLTLYLANDLMLDLQDGGMDNYITGTCVQSLRNTRYTVPCK